ncbi:hypothetical protein ACH5RR_025728 [Cinchona calisaya]|uniref:Uncharacterized protein n=1 Tax=Cinchona calisaya TaxID=153742 RepID=A0ABD2Z2E8_9GENT
MGGTYGEHFAALKYEDDQKTNFVFFQMIRAGREWWRVIQDKWAQHYPMKLPPLSHLALFPKNLFLEQKI